MEKIITYFGQKTKVACDEKCNKAFGINSRPLNLDENIDSEYLSDDELGEAPIDPGTYEGGDAKPVDKSSIPNKWCVRECERCVMSNLGEFDLPLELPDFNLPKKY
ncbi:MAG: hypothetical protein ACK4ON_12480 [Bacteroidia bacterium]